MKIQLFGNSEQLILTVKIMHTLCAQLNWSHMMTDIEFSEL